MIVQLGEGVRVVSESPESWALETRAYERDHWVSVSYHETLEAACLRALSRGLHYGPETLTVRDLVAVLQSAVEVIQAACKEAQEALEDSEEPEPVRSPWDRTEHYPERLEDFDG